MARFRVPRPRATWQGPVGAVAVVCAVALLSGPAWGLLVLGAFLLFGSIGT
jgi:hypothetical protein